MKRDKKILLVLFYSSSVFKIELLYNITTNSFGPKKGKVLSFFETST